MKKNDVFTFTAPNGVEVTAVVLEAKNFFNSDEFQDFAGTNYICYAQNRIFRYREELKSIETANEYEYPELQEVLVGHQQDIIVDYAILPDYDELIQLHSSMDYPLWEQNLEAEIQGMNDR